MNTATSLTWFASHELKLAWLDWATLMSGGRKLRNSAIVIGMAVFALALHALAYFLLSPILDATLVISKPLLVILSGAIALSFTMMLSQALELVTRAFYSRDDLDLILSSPAPAKNLFAVRITMMALTTAMMSALFVAPFINVAAMLAGAHWLSAYAVILTLAFLATAASVALTLLLFATIGAKRTRMVAQIVAAVIGASFLIGIQVAAILSFGTMSRFDVLASQSLIDAAPSINGVVYGPAYAVMGNPTAIAAFSGIALLVFGFAAWLGANRFADSVVTAFGISDETPAAPTRSQASAVFKSVCARRVLIAKEWRLLARDPWLLSQSLMQILYLIPPALMLYVSFAHKTGQAAILVPIIVMALGQLAGGLAWLTLSGEDAPDLIETAPVKTALLMQAKIEAVLIVVAIVVAPLAAGLALISLWASFVTFTGALLAALAAILIQLLFRAQARRTNFRRRHVASRVSTFCEAFASILCAGTASLAAQGSPAAILPAVMTLMVLAVAWLLAPRKA